MEQHVAREQHAVVLEPHGHVALGVGRTDVEQLDGAVTEIDRGVAVDDRGRWGQLDAGEVEGPQRFGERRPVGRQVVGGGERCQQLGRRVGAEPLGATTVGDDLGAGHQLVPEAVVAVVMGVDEPAGHVRMHGGVQVQQLLRGRQVPERVDDQAAARGDEPGVRLPQPGALLQDGMHAVRHGDQLHRSP
ncbi:MAG: hypothetical protein R2699_14815 [Acidimicrobiales bacterium]